MRLRLERLLSQICIVLSLNLSECECGQAAPQLSIFSEPSSSDSCHGSNCVSKSAYETILPAPDFSLPGDTGFVQVSARPPIWVLDGSEAVRDFMEFAQRRCFSETDQNLWEPYNAEWSAFAPHERC